MTETSAVLVRCVDVSCVFGRGATAVVALHGTSCAVPQLARIALVGAYGSGKSTLLHLIAGLESPTHGRIEWPGFDAPERDFQIGTVFQQPLLVDALTVLENAALSAHLAGRPDAAGLAADALTMVGIAEQAAKFPEEISGGQGQRAAVARVLTEQPRLIMADEPTGQLDHATGQRVMDALLSAADRSGAALLVATHDPSIAARLDDRWELHEGRLTSESRR